MDPAKIYGGLLGEQSEPVGCYVRKIVVERSEPAKMQAEHFEV